MFTWKILGFVGAVMVSVACKNSAWQPGNAKTSTANADTISRIVTPNKSIEGNTDSFEVVSLIPAGYEMLDSLVGDLNLDSMPDLLLAMKRKNEEELAHQPDSVIKRILIIATGNIDGSFSIQQQNENAVLCANCGGAMGDPYAALVIKNGYFSIEHYGGSSWRWSRTTTFKYNEQEKNWLLHKEGTESFHSSEPEKVTRTLKTSKETGKILFKDFDIYADQ
jgi:hypothetical protein